MKLFDRIKIKFEKMGKKIAPVTKIEELEHILKELTDEQKSVSTKVHTAQAALNDMDKKIEEFERNNEALKRIAKETLAKEGAESDELRKCYDFITDNKAKLALHITNRESHAKVLASLKDMRSRLTVGINSTKNSLDMLRTKSEFVESLNNLKTGPISTGLDVEAIAKEINLAYDAAVLELEEEQAATSEHVKLEEYLSTHDTGDDKYKKFLEDLESSSKE